MIQRAPPIVIPLLVLRQIRKPYPTCFQAKQVTRSRRVSCTVLLPSILWHNRQTVARMVLRPKPRWFWRLNHQIRTADFEAKIRKPVDLGFEAQQRNPRASSPCARCRLHMASSDLPIIWPPSTRPVLEHPRSSAQGLLLLPKFSSLPVMSHLSPTHHETSKRDSPHKIDSSRTTEMSQIQIQTMTC
jgi:hypothetical protein